MKSRTFLTIFLAVIITSAAAGAVSLASGSNGKDKIFKSWQSLIQPILELQNRVSQLEQENESLQNRVDDLENKVNSLLPHPAPHYFKFNVDVDSVTHDYGTTDTVVFHGEVSPVVESKPAVIRVYDPSGSQIAASSDTPDAQGNFYGDAFDVPSSGDDGIWTVKATYNSVQAFTYFIVDDETDDIFVQLNNNDGQYQAGDQVTITGSVDHTEAGTSDVIITVIDPDNQNIVDQESSVLGAGSLADDAFKYSFTLDSDASPGRYAVEVSYDVDNQAGSTLFEVPDPSLPVFTGDSDTDGSISAQIKEVAYIPGEKVAIQGSIADYDSADNEDLSIIVSEPDGFKVSEYSDASATVKGNGDFDYDFNLAEDAPAGTYTVTITYFGDQLKLMFDVEEP